MEEIINKVQKSGLITLDLEKYKTEKELASFDLKDYLFQGLILKEKDFRADLKEVDWDQYKGKVVCLYCSADAIIPDWAYMLVCSYLFPVAEKVEQAEEMEVSRQLLMENLDKLNPEDYRDQRVILKGCGSELVDSAIYVHASMLLLPVVKTLMYGEPCSTVPIYKQKKS